MLTETEGPPGILAAFRLLSFSNGALNKILERHAHPICFLKLSLAALRLGEQAGIGLNT